MIYGTAVISFLLGFYIEWLILKRQHKKEIDKIIHRMNHYETIIHEACRDHTYCNKKEVNHGL